VVQACCAFLVRQLHPSNCLGIRSYADAQGCSDLQSAAHSYTMVGCGYESLDPQGKLLLGSQNNSNNDNNDNSTLFLEGLFYVSRGCITGKVLKDGKQTLTRKHKGKM
jgi:hypothetical protein